MSRRVSSLVLCGVVGACGGGGGSIVNPPPPQPVASVTVTAPASLFEGQTSQAQVVLADASGASLSGRTVSWSSTNEAVATVSSAGLVTAVAAGSATINATSEGKVGSSPVNVTRDPAPASIALTAPTASIASGGSVQLATVVKNSRGQVITPPSVTYTSSAPGVAAVSGSGLVTSVGPVGAANITATIGTTVASTPVSVTVSPGPIASLAKLVDLPPSATVASSSAFSVKATDAFGNLVPGAAVTFAVTGGGAVTPATATTDASGVAGASFTFGNTVGTNTAVATVAGFSGSAAFSTSTTAAAADSNVVVAGTDGQTAKVGTTVPNPPAVRITDAFGNPIVGVQVTFSTASGGQGQAAFVPTNSDGVAAYDRWVLTTVGTNNLYVNVGSFPQQVFTATGTP